MTTSAIERRLTSTPSATSGTAPRLSTGSRLITGYAATFYRADDPGTEYRLGSDTVERIAPTAFNRAIRERHDVRGLFNHDSNMLLGRTASGTMRLSVDSVGLRYEIDADPQSPLHQTVLRMLQRGDLSGSSFAFKVTKQNVARTTAAYVRTIEDVDLFDVGPVSYPAYKSTTSAARGDQQSVREKYGNPIAARVRQVEREMVADRLRQLCQN